MARKSEQKIVNDIGSVAPNTSQSLQETLRVQAGMPVGSSIQDILANVEGLQPPTARTAQEQLFENLKDELSLTDPFTQYSEQDMLELAETAGLTLDQILGTVAGGTDSVLLEIGDYILLETGDKILIE